jgi:hypothetical protein
VKVTISSEVTIQPSVAYGLEVAADRRLAANGPLMLRQFLRIGNVESLERSYASGYAHVAFGFFAQIDQWHEHVECIQRFHDRVAAGHSRTAALIRGAAASEICMA